MNSDSTEIASPSDLIPVSDSFPKIDTKDLLDILYKEFTYRAELFWRAKLYYSISIIAVLAISYFPGLSAGSVSYEVRLILCLVGFSLSTCAAFLLYSESIELKSSGRAYSKILSNNLPSNVSKLYSLDHPEQTLKKPTVFGITSRSTLSSLFIGVFGVALSVAAAVNAYQINEKNKHPASVGQPPAQQKSPPDKKP